MVRAWPMASARPRRGAFWPRMAAAKAERLNESSAKLEGALQRFSVSRARLNVLIEAVRDVQAAIERVTDIHPKKGRA